MVSHFQLKPAFIKENSVILYLSPTVEGIYVSRNHTNHTLYTSFNNLSIYHGFPWQLHFVCIYLIDRLHPSLMRLHQNKQNVQMCLRWFVFHVCLRGRALRLKCWSLQACLVRCGSQGSLTLRWGLPSWRTCDVNLFSETQETVWDILMYKLGRWKMYTNQPQH